MILVSMHETIRGATDSNQQSPKPSTITHTPSALDFRGAQPIYHELGKSGEMYGREDERDAG